MRIKAHPIALLVIFTINLYSCQQIVDFELPEHEPSVIMNSILRTDSVIVVQLQYDKQILDGNTQYQAIRDAEVVITKNRQPLRTAFEISEGSYWFGEPAEAGAEYKVTAYTPDEDTLESLVIVPNFNTDLQIEKINSFPIETGKRKLQLTYSFTDPVGDNYYEIVLKALVPYFQLYQDIDTSYYFLGGYLQQTIRFDKVNTSLEDLVDTRDASIFSDQLFNGNQLTETIAFDLAYFNPGVNFSNQIDISLELRHISKEYFEYKNSLKLQKSNANNPFFEPSAVFSNVEGGFGIFAGFSIENTNFIYNFE